MITRYLDIQNKAGFSRKKAQTGAVRLIQRFGSALNLNVHFHILFMDGVYTKNKQGKTRFQHIRAPVQEELATLVHSISHRVVRYLERQGVLERDEENSYLQLEGMDEDPYATAHWLLGQLPNSGRISAGTQGVHVTDTTSG